MINYRPAKQQIKDQNDELRRRSVSSAHEDREFVDASNCDSVKDQQSNIFQCECEEDSARRSKGEVTEPKATHHENTGYWQEHNPHESSVEEVATSRTKNKKKATRNRQKRMSQSADAPRQTLWTIKEEIALCNGWLAVSENSRDGNARKQPGFWVEVLEYVESKTKQHGRRTCDMVIGKWKTVRESVIRFCGIYNNVMRMAQESGVRDEDYVQMAMIHYEIDTGGLGVARDTSHLVLVCSTQSGEQSINLNTIVDDNDEEEMQEIRPEGRDKARAAARKKKGSKSRSTSNVNEDALAKLMVI
nr:hypothetical protein [Tanacetum cinerariifolium]